MRNFSPSLFQCLTDCLLLTHLTALVGGGCALAYEMMMVAEAAVGEKGKKEGRGEEFPKPLHSLSHSLHCWASRHSLGFEDEYLASPPAWWAATVATYCPSSLGELPKFLSSKPCK